MGWFQKTLLGWTLTPFNEKVKTYLKKGYEYEVSTHLEGVFNAFVKEHESLGFDAEITSELFIAVAINALENDDLLETKRFVYLKNVATIGGLPYHTKKQNKSMPWREIRDLYIEVSSKHLPSWVIEELWSETNNNSLFLMMFDQIEEKDMEKLNSYFGYETKDGTYHI